jgi:hypothetical protein
MQLPTDDNNKEVQTLAPGTTISLTIGASSDAGTLPAGSEVVRVSASDSCYVAFSSSASSADMLFAAGSEVFKVPAGATQFACIRQGTASGVLTVTRMI